MSRYVNIRLRKSVGMMMDADVSCLNDVKKRFWSRGMFVDVKKIEDDIYDVALDGFAEIGRAPLW